MNLEIGKILDAMLLKVLFFRKGRPAGLRFPHVLIDMLCLPGALSQFQYLNNKLNKKLN